MNLRIPWLFSLLLLAAGQSPLLGAGPEFSGSQACAGCHEQAYAAWQKSHHYQAMLPANEQTVLGDFSDSSFEYGGVTSRFYRRDGRFFVQTDNAEGNLQEFEISHTFGFSPLQQYLVPFPDGRYQALNIVWDARPGAQGGQRWVHLYNTPENPVMHDDMVHWTGAFQNWNSRCATCHSTGLQKNYDAASDSYQTSWEEINVACEACHGPASQHLEWAAGDQAAEARGFAFSLADRGAFGLPQGHAADTFARLDGKRPVTQIETCASCHARRAEMGNHEPGRHFGDLYQLSLVEPGLYFPDGQIRDEVYVYGSFLQSRMFQEGVVCTNCHDPHSNAVRADDNSLCTQCHSSARFDQSAHHHHEKGSEGAACINCHMPYRTYMVVDDRRDHRFGIPEPRLSIKYGTPNACTQCHTDKPAQWALDAVSGWGVSGRIRADHTGALASAWAGGEPAALLGLLSLAGQVEKPAMIRASAVSASQNIPARETLGALQSWLASGDPLLRESAARSVDWLPVAQRYALLQGLIGDGNKAVRMATARQLAELPLDQLPPQQARPLRALFREYQDTMRFNADMPEEQVSLGLFHSARGDIAAAEKAYRSALKLSPAYPPALLNLADLYRANDMDQQAAELLRKALEILPDSAPPNHAMGLLLVRQGKLPEALPYLQLAAAAEPGNVRYAYVFAVARWESGDRDGAVSELESALDRFPANRELASALASYYQQTGETDKLQKLIEKYTP